MTDTTTHHQGSTTDVERSSRRGGLALDDWFDRWPGLFTRRWPEAFGALPFAESFRVEERTESDGTIVIRAELPGVDPDDGIEVTVDGKRLTIRAHREERSEDRENDTVRSEVRYGSMVRSFRLPEGADEDSISATCDSGILEVRVPCAGEPPAPKSIPVGKNG